MYWFMKLAFMTPAEISTFPPHFYPHEPTISAFFNMLGFSHVTFSGRVFLPSGQAGQVKLGLLNSVILASVVTCVTLLVALPLSYIFGRFRFRQKNRLFFAILFSVAIPPISILIPFYILFVKIGLAGTVRGLMLVTPTVTIPFVTWMMLGFFRNLPPVERLARIDGYTRFGTFVKIVLPMAKTGIAVGAIISFLFAWNEYTFAWVLVNGTPATTLPPAISGFLFQAPEPQHLVVSVIYSLIPPFIVAYLLQKHITKMNIVEPLG
jgi:multiple sugar transport system permease protein